MSEKPWCHKCGERHDDPRLELDGPLWVERACAGKPPTVAETLFILTLAAALVAFAALAVFVLPFSPVVS